MKDASFIFATVLTCLASAALGQQDTERVDVNNKKIPAAIFKFIDQMLKPG